MQLIITEKPSVAMTLARVLGVTEKKNGYLEGNDRIVSWCFGHLVEPVYPEDYDEAYKEWKYETLPIIPSQWKYQVKEDTKEQFGILKSLMNDERVTEVVEATDCGREGELIFRLVYEQAGCDKPIRRLWINSMEDSAILKGMEELKPGSLLDNLYNSARCRQCADWLVGLNGTRLFTVLYQGRTLKVGRVQTPTLAMVVDREVAIRSFKKTPYYTIQMKLGGYTAVSDKYASQEEAENAAAGCIGKEAVIRDVVREEKAVRPPKLYDLTSLQRDANRTFGFTAKQTLDLTQALYEKGLVTYPRTDSRYLSDDMGQTVKDVCKAVMENILMNAGAPYVPDTSGVLDSKKVTDHHAIIPTMKIEDADLKELSDDEMKILNLIACRLLCATADKYRYESMTAKADCGGIIFTIKGKRGLEKGWKAYEEQMKAGYRLNKELAEEEPEDVDEAAQEDVFEELKDSYDNLQIDVAEGFTKPPAHFTEATILTAMEHAGADEICEEAERKGLGTTATRADIIEKLIKDGFLRREKKMLISTEDGEKLITILPDKVKSAKLTAEWENDLTLVAKGEKTAFEFMRSIEDMVRELVGTYHSVTEEEKQMFRPVSEVLGHCPNCGKEVAFGKYGAFCTGKCGLSIQKAMGQTLTPVEIRNVLAGKKIFKKGLKSKAGKTYDAYLIPDGVEKYTYEKDGVTKNGVGMKYRMEFPKDTGKKKK